MIYTVTLNPSLDYMVEVPAFQLRKTNRTDNESLKAGGKGINVSLLLKNLGLKSTALGFVGGFIGEEILRQLDEQGITHYFIKVAEGNSRINVKLINEEGTEINGQGPVISVEEEALLLKQFEKVEAGDVVILSGSIPPSLPQDWYLKVMKILKQKQVLVVLDTAGDSLLKSAEYKPFLIKPNHHELGQLYGVELHTRQDVIPYGKQLQNRGFRNVLISLAGEGAVLLAEDGQVVLAEAPKGNLQNSVGAGDAMVAGFVAGWLDKKEYEWAFRMAVASGSASAFLKGFATKSEIMELLESVQYTKALK